MIDIQYVIACDKYNPIGKSWWIRHTSDLQSSIIVSSSFELWGYAAQFHDIALLPVKYDTLTPLDMNKD